MSLFFPVERSLCSFGCIIVDTQYRMVWHSTLHHVCTTTSTLQSAGDGGAALSSFFPLNFHRLQPGGSRQTHMLLSAVIWSSVGLMLLAKGIIRAPYLNEYFVYTLLAALAVGSCKSLLFLDRAANRIIYRISGFTESTWLFAVYSWKTWLLVIVMMVLGVLLKYSFHPTIVLSFVYCTVGWGLFFSSRNMWRAFRKIQQGEKE